MKELREIIVPSGDNRFNRIRRNATFLMGAELASVSPEQVQEARDGAKEIIEQFDWKSKDVKQRIRDLKTKLNLINQWAEQQHKKQNITNSAFDDISTLRKKVSETFGECMKHHRFGKDQRVLRLAFLDAAKKNIQAVQQAETSNVAILLNKIEESLLNMPADSQQVAIQEWRIKFKALRDTGKVTQIPFSEEFPKKNFELLYTGGTIGSVRIHGEILQPSEAREKYGEAAKDLKPELLEKYNARYANLNIEIGQEFIMETLSEDLITEKRIELAKKLKGILDKIDPKECNGIILTHGSDTLGHTANLLALVLADMKLKVPVVLVSSNYALDHPDANGVENLKGAVDFLTHINLPPNVYVMENSKHKDEVEVILASRVTQCQLITDKYLSASIGKKGQKPMRPLGVIAHNKFTVYDQELFDKLQTEKPDDRPSFNLLDRIDSLKDDKVLRFQPRPGLKYNSEHLKGYSAVLHGTYHGGSACTYESKDKEIQEQSVIDQSVVEFAKICHNKGIPFYYGPVYGAGNRDTYGSTTKIANTEGVRTVMNLSPEMLSAKLDCLPLFDNIQEFEKFLYTDIDFEFLLPDTKLNIKGK